MLPADRIQIRIHHVVCRLHLTAFFLLLFRCHSAIALPAQSGSTPDVGFYLGLQLAAFADLSTAWDRGADFTRNMIGGAGFGIRLIIPILDMIRLDFAFGQSGQGILSHFGLREKADYERLRVR